MNRAISMTVFASALGTLFWACSSSNGTTSPPASGGTGSTTGGSASVAGSNSQGAGTGGVSGASTTSGGSSPTGGATNGGGSSAGAASTCGPADADCASAAALMTKVVSDFESGNGWFLFAPDDKGATSNPPAGDNVPISQILCPTNGRCGSNFAMHVTGSGYTSYGPSLSQDYVYKDADAGLVGMPQDFSMYTGVMYWARRGDTAAAAPTLRLIVNDVNTHALGGVCDPTAATGSSTKPSNACFDGWMAEKAIPTVWTLVKLPFSVLKQGGFGKMETAIVPSKIYGLTFQMPNMATFDFWIDDVSFYKE